LSESHAAVEALSVKALAAEHSAKAALTRADAEMEARVAAEAQIAALSVAAPASVQTNSSGGDESSGGSDSVRSKSNSAPGDTVLNDLVSSLRDQLASTRTSLAEAQAQVLASDVRTDDAEARVAAANSKLIASERATAEAKANAADLALELAAVREAAAEASEARDAIENAMRQTAHFRQKELEASMHELIDACERGDEELAALRAANEELQRAVHEADANAATKAVTAAASARAAADAMSNGLITASSSSSSSAAGAQDASVLGAAAQPQQNGLHQEQMVRPSLRGIVEMDQQQQQQQEQEQEQPPPPAVPGPTMVRALKAEAEVVELRSQLDEALAALSQQKQKTNDPAASSSSSTAFTSNEKAGADAAAWAEERADLLAQVANLRVLQDRASSQHEAWVNVLQEAHEQSAQEVAREHAYNLEVAVEAAAAQARTDAIQEAQEAADTAISEAEARCAKATHEASVAQAEIQALRDALSDVHSQSSSSSASSSSDSATSTVPPSMCGDASAAGDPSNSGSSCNGGSTVKKPPLLILTLKCAVLEFLRSEDPRPGKGLAVAGMSTAPKTVQAIRAQALKVRRKRQGIVYTCASISSTKVWLSLY